MTLATKLGAVACASLLVLSLGACGSSSNSDSNSADTSSDASQEQQAQQAEPAQDSPYQVTIDNAQVVKANAICLTFTFTNNSDEAQAFGTATSVTVYQDGVQQDTAIPADSPANYGNVLNKVKPGASITVDSVYALANTTSPVEVEVTELFDLDQTVLAEKTFNLS